MARAFNTPSKPSRNSSGNDQYSNSNSSNQSYSIYVGNIPFDTNENDLHSYFHDYCGNVNRVKIIYDHETGRNRGFAFVDFRTLESYQAGLSLNDSQFQGRKLRISARSESKNTSSTNTGASASGANTRPQKTTVVHCKKSKYDVYIGRPSDWGNPFVIGKDGDRADVIRKYREWIMRQPNLLARVKPELRGRTIACWCKPEHCHGDVLAELADAD